MKMVKLLSLFGAMLPRMNLTSTPVMQPWWELDLSRHRQARAAKSCLIKFVIWGLIFGTAFPSVTTALASTIPAPNPQSNTQQPWQIEWDKVVQEAKKEGEISIICSLGPSTISKLSEAIKKKYGIKLTFISMARGAQLTEKLFTERRAGIYTFDVIISGATTSINVLKPRGFLQPLEPFMVLPEAKDKSAWRGDIFVDKEHTLIPLATGFNRYIIRNTTLIKENEITSYTDLLKPKWKGRMIVNDPTKSGAGNAWLGLMVDAWGLEKTREYLKQFIKQEPVLTNDIRLQVESVSRGKYFLGIATSTETTMQFIALGAPITVVRTIEGASASTSASVVSLPSKPPHPNGAKLLLNWLLTKEGQTIFSEGYGVPASRKDVPLPPGFNPLFLPQPGEPIQWDTEEGIRKKGTVVLKLGKEAFSPLQR